ncbi:MAG TPA: YihY/virulence factor BrkB family protein [Sphingobacteriaceae bacterium]|nr:YihY/virulence factor BrkB family protein [Sphingobacteriaceae bacterium]
MRKIFTKRFYGEVLDLLLLSAKGFSADKAMKMSASLAYYAIFSIAPLLLIIIWLVGFLFGEYVEGQQGVQTEVFEEFAALFGTEVAQQIQQVIQKISVSNKSGLGIAIGIITLIIGSTTIFMEIQDSINTIWKVKAKPQKGWLKMILNRALSFSMVVGLGFLLITSLILNGIIGALSSYINKYLPDISVYVMGWVNVGITFIIITVLFGTIFSALPDARMRFRDVLGGSLFTGMLFMLGRFLISIYMQFAAPASAYGAAGSLIVLLLWVYYSAAILYFGAEFTKIYAEKYGNGIRPSSYAVRVVQQEIEKQ